jgi:5'-3' exonuclease
MGIPSYYKKLIDTIHGLISKGRPSGDISWLFMDFNCLIYHCLYREDTPPYPTNITDISQKDDWENLFLECIVKYCLKVIKEVDPKAGVYIAIDGVVPMAKMRQQRLRRFKSVWAAHHDETNTITWDRNAITPGTLFMKKLRHRLESMITTHGRKKWVLSSSDEPGEGEHKIISEWRKGGYSGNFAVYGLDADLIVLSILGQESCKLDNNIWLFREEVNAGKITYDSFGEEVFEWFSIDLLKKWLVGEFGTDPVKCRQFILNYCFAMSVLGNDFLPSSLGLKIRDDGHSELLDTIKSFTQKEIHLVDSETLQISFNGVKTLFNTLALNEDSRIKKYVSKKIMIARNYSDDTKIGDNNWPLKHIEENVLINNKELCSNWTEKYMSNFFNGMKYSPNNISRVCADYLHGIQWIWAYYNGLNDIVCFNWVYSFNLPPLWQWLYDYLNNINLLPTIPNIRVKASDIRPVEQLVLVLPLESWSLIPPCPESSLPKYVPEYFPSVFSFDTVGKRYFWECESLIPLPSILEIKEIIKNYT